MPNGYIRKILRVDLTSREISIDRHDDVFYRTYVGGARDHRLLPPKRGPANRGTRWDPRITSLWPTAC